VSFFCLSVARVLVCTLHTNEMPVHTNEGPVHTNEGPVHTNEGPVHTNDLTISDDIEREEAYCLKRGCFCLFSFKRFQKG
jgi:hypothetical protein